MANAKLTLNPVSLHLGDLPAEGREFKYSRLSGELNPFLDEFLVGQNYEIEINIRPEGNVFMVAGRIQAATDDLCALCGFEFVRPIIESFQEILMVRSPRDHEGEHQARVNHSSELALDGPEFTELESDFFHVGEYLRELIAVTAPIKSTPRPDCDSNCENYQEAVRKGWLTQGDDEGFRKTSPFKALAGVKLNS